MCARYVMMPKSHTRVHSSRELFLITKLVCNITRGQEEFGGLGGMFFISFGGTARFQIFHISISSSSCNLPSVHLSFGTSYTHRQRGRERTRIA